MQLKELLQDLYPIDTTIDRKIFGVAQNSRYIKPQYLFLACKGRTLHGIQFIDEAIRKGAIAVVAQSEVDQPQVEWWGEVPVIYLKELKDYLPEISAKYFNYPAKKLKNIGVTGTNGKTSCSHFVAQGLEYLNHACGVIGTLGDGFLNALHETAMTTPDTVSLHQIFSDLIHQKAEYVSMEVSSHSLDQKRIQGIEFDVGIFTNLTQDHLDYHGNMEAYGLAKKSFFMEYPMNKAVINADDNFGRLLITELSAQKILAYTTSEKIQKELKGRGIDCLYAHHLNFNREGMQARVLSPWGEGAISSSVIGTFNVSNLLATLACFVALEIPFREALTVIPHLKPVPGRMQMLGGETRPHIVVDYAHTPDALEKALLALRHHCEGSLYCLFGCGGDRDTQKRSMMGAIAEKLADVVMLTNDNPRHENPDQIINDILVGIKVPQKIKIQTNRSQAIHEIIQYASAGDYILIAGKGAENYQQIGDEKIHFNDVEMITDILRGF